MDYEFYDGRAEDIVRHAHSIHALEDRRQDLVWALANYADRQNKRDMCGPIDSDMSRNVVQAEYDHLKARIESDYQRTRSDDLDTKGSNALGRENLVPPKIRWNRSARALVHLFV